MSRRLTNKSTSIQMLRVNDNFRSAHTISIEPGQAKVITDPEYASLILNPAIFDVEDILDSIVDTSFEALSSVIRTGALTGSETVKAPTHSAVSTAITAATHTHTNMTTLNGTQESFTTALKTSYDNTVSLTGNYASKLLYIDKNRTETYVENGSFLTPYKTIAAAVAKAVLNGDGATVPYSFILSSGTYAEEINLNSTGLFNVSFIGLGRVAIDPAAGNALTCITANSNMTSLNLRNLEFGKPVAIVGDGTANQFSNQTWVNCSFGSTVSITCANALALWDVYSDAGGLTINNVNYLYVGGGQIAGPISATMDATTTLPTWGANGGAIVFGLICNDITVTITGAATWNPSFHNSRIGGSAGVYTIPAGCNMSLYSSVLRGTWTNNGALALKNAQLENALAGTAPVFTANKSIYVNYSSTTPAHWATAPTNVNSAVDRLAAAIFGLNGGVPIA